jgi:mycothiol synthase
MELSHSTPVLILAPLLLFILYLGLKFLFGEPWPLRMRRSLGDLPPVAVPDGYRLRSYQSVDGEGWVQLVNAAFATEKCVPGQAISVQASRAARQRVLYGINGPDRPRILLAEGEASGELVGTAEAAESSFMGRRVGLIAWVAVHPAHRGRRLGEALVVAALHDLRERGHTEAMLYTNPKLAAANRLYERLGFKSGKAQWQ